MSDCDSMYLRRNFGTAYYPLPYKNPKDYLEKRPWLHHLDAIHRSRFCAFSVVFCNSDFLGAFAKLRKASISFIMSVRPHGSTRLPLDGFSRNFIFEVFFRNSVKKIQVLLESDKYNGCLHEDQYTFSTIYGLILLITKNISDKNCRVTRNTPWYSVTFFDNRAVY